VDSTAVPGLAAKLVLDIMVGVRSLDDSPVLVEHLVGIGYEYVPEFERVLPFRRYFRKVREGRTTGWPSGWTGLPAVRGWNGAGPASTTKGARSPPPAASSTTGRRIRSTSVTVGKPLRAHHLRSR
jgi:hypothetical protein